jgi:hypothetical protein
VGCWPLVLDVFSYLDKESFLSKLEIRINAPFHIGYGQSWSLLLLLSASVHSQPTLWQSKAYHAAVGCN